MHIFEVISKSKSITLKYVLIDIDATLNSNMTNFNVTINVISFIRFVKH